VVNSSRDSEPASDMVDQLEEPQSRRDLLRTGGVAAVAGLLGVFGIATTAAAANGAAIRAGERNSATRPTVLISRKGPTLNAAVTGGGAQVGVRGSSKANRGIGVQGEATAGKGKTVGVQGRTGSRDGVAGQFVATAGGTALEASSPAKRGVALRTKGRLEITERSGSALVSEGGAEFVIPVEGGLSERSLVLATLQDHRPGIHVEAAYVLDVEDGLIVVRLNQAVPEQTKVAWFVLH
jgi:hypothetical protein